MARALTTDEIKQISRDNDVVNFVSSHKNVFVYQNSFYEVICSNYEYSFTPIVSIHALAELPNTVVRTKS